MLGLVALLSACGGGSSEPQGDSSPTEAATTAAVEETSEEAGEDAIVVEQSAVSVGKDLVNYGAVLKNTSDEDAVFVYIKGSFVDKSGTILDGVGPVVPVIPAGATYYWGGSWPVKGGTPTKIEISTEVSEFQDNESSLPEVSDIKLGTDGFNTIITGRVTNTLDFPLSQVATVQVVFFDASGKVIGGSNGYLPADLPPGRTARFEVNAFNNLSPKEIASVKITVDAQPVP